MFDFTSWNREVSEVAKSRNARAGKLLVSLPRERQKEVLNLAADCRARSVDFNLADLIESALL